MRRMWLGIVIVVVGLPPLSQSDFIQSVTRQPDTFFKNKYVLLL